MTRQSDSSIVFRLQKTDQVACALHRDSAPLTGTRGTFCNLQGGIKNTPLPPAIKGITCMAWLVTFIYLFIYLFIDLYNVTRAPRTMFNQIYFSPVS